jgi:hypothetical protein
MSKLETNTIDTISGTSTLQVGSTNTSTITLGVSGDTINVPSGVTINNNGTQTGFGGANTPAFEAFLSSDQSISDNTNTKIQFMILQVLMIILLIIVSPHKLLENILLIQK